MQAIIERNFPPFPERFDKLVELMGKTRAETAKTLGVTIQAVNQKLDDAPIDRRLLVELLIEKLERKFQPADGTLEKAVRDIVKDELRKTETDLAGLVQRLGLELQAARPPEASKPPAQESAPAPSSAPDSTDDKRRGSGDAS
jgi:hypothetical protein